MHKIFSVLKDMLLNIELYFTIIIAIGLGICNFIGYAPSDWVSSATLAALGVVTIDALRQRHNSKKIKDQLLLLNSQTASMSEKISLSHLISFTGLVGIKNQSREIDWDDMFENVSEIDLFFTYARTWRNANNNLLYKFARKNDSRLRVILPDPNNVVILSELSNRFSKSSEEFRNLINEAKEEYAKVQIFAKQCNGGSVEVWYTSVTPMYSLYRFDRTVLISLGSYKPIKGNVPHLIADRRGTLYQFVREEIDALLNGDSRQLSHRII